MPLANFPHRKAPPRERCSGASGALAVLGRACSHSDMRTAKAAQCRFEIQVTGLAGMTDIRHRGELVIAVAARERRHEGVLDRR